MTPPRNALAWGCVVAFVVVAPACRPRAPRQGGRDLSQASIDDVEHELARNSDRLAEEGVVVESATTRDAGAAPNRWFPPPERTQPEPGPEPGPPEAEPDEEEPEPTSPEPGPEPGPEPSPEPAPRVDAPDDYDMPVESKRHVSPVSRESMQKKRGRRREARRDAQAPSRCERICDLADSTCDLAAQICDLATRHPGDARYEDACRRADRQCQAASMACDQCAAG